MCFISEQTKEKDLAEQVECRGKNLTTWEFSRKCKCRQAATTQ